MTKDSAPLSRPAVCVPLALLCTLLWGVSYPLVKTGYAAFRIDTSSVPDIMLFAGVRFVISGLILIVFNIVLTAAKDGPRGVRGCFPGLGSLWTIVLLGLLLTAVHYIFMYIGLANTESSKGSILKQVGILFAIFLAPLFDSSDKFTLRKLVGCAAGFAGIVVCNLDGGGFSFNLGDGFVVLAALSVTFGDVCSKKLGRGFTSIFLSGWQQFTGGAVLLAVGLVSGGSIGYCDLRGALALGLLILASVVAYTLWMLLLKYNELSTLSLFKFTIPVFGVLASGVILGENVLNAAYWISIVLICAGIYIANKKQR